MEKGSTTIPIVVGMVLVTFVFGGIGTGTLIGMIKSQATSASQAGDADWIASNVVSPGRDLCKQSGIQGPLPSDSNSTHTFNNLRWINTTYTAITYPIGVSGTQDKFITRIVLGYETGDVQRVVWSYNTQKITIPCREDTLINPDSWIPSINGTKPDGTKFSTGYSTGEDSFNVTSDELKIRLFEIDRDKIQIQVRQD